MASLEHDAGSSNFRSQRSRQCEQGGAEFSRAYNPLYSWPASSSACSSGMTGVGGGSLMTPILVLLFGFHPATAVGTDLLYASVTKTVGTAVHGKRRTRRLANRHGTCMRQRARPRSSPIFVMSRVGTLERHAAGVSQPVPRVGAAADQHLGLLPAVDPPLGRSATSDALELGRRTPLDGRSSALVLGVLVTVTSVGAGALGTTALLILYPRLPVARIAAQRHRPCGSADSDCGYRPLADRLGRFHLMLALLARIDPRHHHRQPACGTKATDNVHRPVLAVMSFAKSFRRADAAWLKRRVNRRDGLHDRRNSYRVLNNVGLDPMLEQHPLVAIDAHAAAVHRRYREREKLEIFLGEFRVAR